MTDITLDHQASAVNGDDLSVSKWWQDVPTGGVVEGAVLTGWLTGARLVMRRVNRATNDRMKRAVVRVV